MWCVYIYICIYIHSIYIYIIIYILYNNNNDDNNNSNKINNIYIYMFIKQIYIYLSTVHGGQKSTLQQRLQHLQPGALLRQLLLQIDRTHGAHIVGFHLLRNSTMVLGQKPPGLRCQKHPMGVIKGYSNGLHGLLVGGWPTPLKNNISQLGLLFQILWTK